MGGCFRPEAVIAESVCECLYIIPKPDLEVANTITGVGRASKLVANARLQRQATIETSFWKIAQTEDYSG